MLPLSRFRYLLYLLPLLFLIQFLRYDFQSAQAKSGGSQLIVEKQQMGLPWKTWSPQALEQAKADRTWVFMDFTAKWCFTCKVNERLVIHTDKFKNLVSEKKIRLLLADWTRRDPVIEAWLRQHGHVGVPAYFLQAPDGRLIDLGETLSFDEIKKQLP